MRNHSKNLLFILMFSLLSQSLKASNTVIDDRGQTVHLDKPAKRIVSLAPDITEILFAIGAGNKVVATINPSNYPLAAQKIMRVGSASGIDLEAIISLHPDLIVVWEHTFSRQLLALQPFHIPVFTTAPHHLEDIPSIMRRLGGLTGTTQAATQIAKKFSQQLAILYDHYHAQQSLTVFYQLDAYSLITINKNSWINQVITLCGGQNIFAQATFTAPVVSWESVLVANPQVILSDSTELNWKKRWISWRQITAVKHRALFAINPDLIERAGPRLLIGIADVCRDLQQARKTFAH